MVTKLSSSSSLESKSSLSSASTSLISEASISLNRIKQLCDPKQKISTHQSDENSDFEEVIGNKKKTLKANKLKDNLSEEASEIDEDEEESELESKRNKNKVFKY